VGGSAGTHIFSDQESLDLALHLKLEIPVGGR
jgi:hypothetical protein